MNVGERLYASTADDWRRWLQDHGATKREIWLMFYKKGIPKSGIEYSRAVEEALCYGWIDGQLKGVDQESYALRFSPRTRRSHWSAANRALARRLIAEGRMTQSGRDVLPADWEDNAEPPL